MNIKCVTVNSRSYSLRSYLDELLEELDSLTELPAEADLGDHPQLNLVEPAQKQVQVGRGSPKVLPTKCVVQKLMLGRRREKTFRRSRQTTSATLHPLSMTPAEFFGGGFLKACVCYLMHTAKELPVKHGHLVSQILRTHQLKSRHGARRGTLLFWKRSLRHTKTQLWLTHVASLKQCQ